MNESEIFRAVQHLNSLYGRGIVIGLNRINATEFQAERRFQYGHDNRCIVRVVNNGLTVRFLGHQFTKAA